MRIEELKVMVDFLELQSTVNFYDLSGDENRTHLVRVQDTDDGLTFNPGKKEGFHWIREILRKFDEQQYNKYDSEMFWKWEEEIRTKGETYDRGHFPQWKDTAPSEICCKCIIETLEEK